MEHGSEVAFQNSILKKIIVKINQSFHKFAAHGSGSSIKFYLRYDFTGALQGPWEFYFAELSQFVTIIKVFAESNH
ncbi:hypothetical protein DEO72_LG1g2720 [Vigna unguiculata]|uniref:Uncharacterized protein n=1 Tax=Vigna unguiculata TaxID=3917 RepID=A0A4D6KNF3_VIGUN|nr:hypothetical protein DEO72_LG1g2720 [Vigna unguiculata]